MSLICVYPWHRTNYKIDQPLIDREPGTRLIHDHSTLPYLCLHFLFLFFCRLHQFVERPKRRKCKLYFPGCDHPAMLQHWVQYLILPQRCNSIGLSLSGIGNVFVLWAVNQSARLGSHDLMRDQSWFVYVVCWMIQDGWMFGTHHQCLVVSTGKLCFKWLSLFSFLFPPQLTRPSPVLTLPSSASQNHSILLMIKSWQPPAKTTQLELVSQDGRNGHTKYQGSMPFSFYS